MPDLLGDSGDFFASLPAWDQLTPKQQGLFDQALEAVLLWGQATRNFMAGTGGETFSTETFADYYDRGMVLYNHNHDRRGKFAPGGAGGAVAAGGAGKGAAKSGGGGGGGGGAPKAAKAARASKSTKAPAAPKAKVAPKAGAKAKAGKAAAVTKAAVAVKPKGPTVAELKAAAELRVKTATTHARHAEREYKPPEKVAAGKRANNAAELNSLPAEAHQA